MCKVRCWRWLFGNEMPISLYLLGVEVAVVLFQNRPHT